MKRWILITAALVVGVIAAVVALPGVVGTSYAAWNATAPVTTGISAGTWAATPVAGPVTAGSGPTKIIALNWQLSSPVQFCTSGLKVGTTSSTPVPWVLSIDTKQAPFNGAAPTQVEPTATLSGPNANGILTITGANSISGAQTQDVTICLYTGGMPPAVATAGPSTYTVGAFGITSYNGFDYACISGTVTGYSEFYVGWTATLDWDALLAAKYGRGSTEYKALIVKPLGSWAATSPRGGGTMAVTRSGNVYTGTGNDGWTSSGIKSGETQVVTACT
ncbi:MULTISPECIES: hypothetical protein [unclassified Leifsonia]|uniref:hypothetical protein n=1 Tax=unclassified Leifsonia TaxID=2663824 RepID=UPI0006F84C2C|nr:MULTISPECIES: hypothetical protein [unclassified Leifsonia]KQX06837.1 hypothetical protein ASC59_03155 [Leifsonia sp. Root1293]KRA11122.1 hypothetical protein ASD61_03155 [Leifsonia sp. Root60]